MGYLKAIPIIVKRVIAQDQLMEETFSSLLSEIGSSHLSGEIDASSYKKVLHGMFQVLHEHHNLLGGALSATSFTDVIENMASQIKKVDPLNPLQDFKMDPFETSPLDGSSIYKTKDDIISRMLDKPEAFKVFQRSHATANVLKDILRSDIEDIDIASFSGLYIDVCLSLKDKSKVHYSLPTQYYFYKDVLHSTKSIKLADASYIFESKSLENLPLDEQKRVAREEMKEIQEKIDDHMNLFIKTSIDLLLKPRNDTGILNEKYKFHLDMIVKNFNFDLEKSYHVSSLTPLEYQMKKNSELIKEFAKIDEFIAKQVTIQKRGLEAAEEFMNESAARVSARGEGGQTLDVVDISENRIVEDYIRAHKERIIESDRAREEVLLTSTEE